MTYLPYVLNKRHNQFPPYVSNRFIDSIMIDTSATRFAIVFKLADHTS